jgi:hypothetical protein
VCASSSFEIGFALLGFELPASRYLLEAQLNFKLLAKETHF